MGIPSTTRSTLGSEQILQYSFDETNGSLRTTPGAPVGTATEVAISHDDDSIKIGDGTDLLAISASGEASVADSTARTSLSSIDTKLTRQGTLTDASGTMGGAGTSSTLAAADSACKYLIYQNISTDTHWINFGSSATAGAGSFKIQPMGVMVFESSYVTTQAIHGLGVAGSSAFTLKRG